LPFAAVENVKIFRAKIPDGVSGIVPHDHRNEHQVHADAERWTSPWRWNGILSGALRRPTRSRRRLITVSQ
jgi:hypothetical protein